jgi:hypothetical protein
VGLKAKLRAEVWLARHPGVIRRLHGEARKGRSVSDAEILAERLDVLLPQEMAVGTVGNVSIAICNALFALNHRIAHRLCRLAGL